MKDKNGIEIEEFDVLKVYHFTGARRKKYFMYKVVIRWEGDGNLYASHIESNPLKPGYPINDKNEPDTEIIQSQNWRKLK